MIIYEIKMFIFLIVLFCLVVMPYTLSKYQTKFNKRYNKTKVSKVTIKRHSNIVYISINDEEDESVMDFSTLSKTFTSPLAIGASINGNGNPQRYYEGTLKNISFVLYE